MSPLDWAFLCFQRYVTFYGRSARAEYWWFCLFQFLLSLVTMLIDVMLGLGGPDSPISTNFILAIGLFLPSLAVTVRRLHDINRSGWTVLVYVVLTLVVVIVGGVLSLLLGEFGTVLMVLGIMAVSVKFIFLMASEGSRGDNGYGPNPYGLCYGY